MEKTIGAGKKVCVTGASGYIASWIVKLLLDRGYTVHGTVRDPNDPKRTEHLMALDGAKERLRLFKADLAQEGSFFSAIDGCDGVFHTASPLNMDAEDPQVEIVDIAVKGTLEVLAACAKVPTVKRVILTSSMAAVQVNGQSRTPDVVIDESWFSDPVICKSGESKLAKNANWYVLSKTLAEDAAWKFAKENGIDMVVMNPAVIIGPLLQPTLNGSSSIILGFINGAKTYKNLRVGWVHVEDVARAHVLAYTIPSANGRYCLAESVAHLLEIVKILRELYPTLPLPDKCADDEPLVPTYQISKDKTKSLGINYIPLKTSIKDAVESLKEKKLVNF